MNSLTSRWNAVVNNVVHRPCRALFALGLLILTANFQNSRIPERDEIHCVQFRDELLR